MAKGQWVKGKESALWAGAVPGLRPGTFARLRWCLFCLILIRAVARIVEIAGDRACIGLGPLGSAILSRPAV